MAGRRKKKEANEGSPELPVEVGESASTAVMESPVTAAKEQPPFEPTGHYTPAANELAPETPLARGRFRSWVSDASRGYSRLSDNEQRRIVLIFDEKPPADVLTAVKGAAFQYHPEYQGMKNAWTRYDNHEGRIQAEAIDDLVRSTIPGDRSPER